jgi:urease accessory protein
LGGADHVLAMLAVGLWAALTGGRAMWAMPLAFVGALLAGGAMGATGIALPGVEPMILASILVLGGAVALALRLPLPVALAGIAVFGLAHGFAHGAEGPAVGFAAYAAGFVLATAGLHIAGLVAGLALRRAVPVTRALGALTAAAGAALALGVTP